MRPEEIEGRFAHHAPDAERAARHEAVRHAARGLATCLNDLCPDGREKSLAVTRLEEAVMWADAAIARADP